MAAEGQRLDLWLAGRREITRSAARTLIDVGAVAVNGHRGRPGQRIGPADEVVVVEPEPRQRDGAPGPPVPLTVLYDDASVAVIDKPAGLVVHPAPGHESGTLADGLRQRGDTWSLLGGRERAGIVHRLDRDTSGLLVVAKTEAAHRSLAAQLANRTLGRTYWALVRGVLPEASGTIDAPIARDRRDRKRMAVDDGGRASVTDFVVVERLARHTILDVSLRSGRTHQIRVHLAYIGHPIVCDPVYGRPSKGGGRLALHARLLRFHHPVDGRDCVVESPLPDDLAALTNRVRHGDEP